MIQTDSETWREIEKLATGRLAQIKAKLLEDLPEEKTRSLRADARAWAEILKLPEKLRADEAIANTKGPFSHL